MNTIWQLRELFLEHTYNVPGHPDLVDVEDESPPPTPGEVRKWDFVVMAVAMCNISYT